MEQIFDIKIREVKESEVVASVSYLLLLVFIIS
jgi:hypothetical protein